MTIIVSGKEGCGPVTPWLIALKEVIDGVTPAEAVDLDDSDKMEILLESERAGMVIEDETLSGSLPEMTRPYGLRQSLSESRDTSSPLPKKCPYDGTMIGYKIPGTPRHTARPYFLCTLARNGISQAAAHLLLLPCSLPLSP